MRCAACVCLLKCRFKWCGVQFLLRRIAATVCVYVLNVFVIRILWAWMENAWVFWMFSFSSLCLCVDSISVCSQTVISVAQEKNPKHLRWYASHWWVQLNLASALPHETCFFLLARWFFPYIRLLHNYQDIKRLWVFVLFCNCVSHFVAFSVYPFHTIAIMTFTNFRVHIQTNAMYSTNTCSFSI